MLSYERHLAVVLTVLITVLAAWIIMVLLEIPLPFDMSVPFLNND